MEVFGFNFGSIMAVIGSVIFCSIIISVFFSYDSSFCRYCQVDMKVDDDTLCSVCPKCGHIKNHIY